MIKKNIAHSIKLALMAFAFREEPPTAALPRFEGATNNALVMPMHNIQTFARARRPGVYMLTQPWNAYAVTSYKNEIHLLAVCVHTFAMVVISADPSRTHGRAYRMRVNSATVTRINKVNGLNDFDLVDHFEFAPMGAVRSIHVNDQIDYQHTFYANHEHMHGRGLYVSPSFREAMKLLAYILRYNNKRLQRINSNEARNDNSENKNENQVESDNDNSANNIITPREEVDETYIMDEKTMDEEFERLMSSHDDDQNF